MCRRVPLAVMLCCLSCCRDTEPTEAERRSLPPAAASPQVEPKLELEPEAQPAVAPGPVSPAPAARARTDEALPPPLRFPGTEYDHDFILERLSRAQPRSFKPVGSTSTVFRMRLYGDVDGAFKTVTAARPHGPASEVAAYRLARCLQLPNVAPAISRRIAIDELQELLVEDANWAEISQRITPQPDGTALGVAIYWVTDLTDVGIERAKGVERWSSWLSLGGPLPKKKHQLAGSVSTMLAFDYLIGNFDRWSGGNARGSADQRLVYLRDHDLAFPRGMGAHLHRRVWRRLLRAERFSKSFYRSVKTLSRECFESELSQDPEGAAGRLLTPALIDAVFDRRDGLLSHIESLIALHGEETILVFE